MKVHLLLLLAFVIVNGKSERGKGKKVGCKKSSCEHKCIDTPGGYTCVCNTGFAVSRSNPEKCNAIKKCPIEADVIFVMDASDSIGPEYYELQKDFVKSVTDHFSIGPHDVRFAALVFSDYTVKAFDLGDFDDASSIAAKISTIPYLKGMTYTDDALSLIISKNLFSSVNGGRPKAVDIVIVITDGASQHPDLTIAEAKKLKGLGATIISVGIGSEITDKELQAIASDADSAIRVNSYDVLYTIEQLLADRTCESKIRLSCAEAGNSICSHICEDTRNGFVCKCQEGFKLENNTCKDIDECQEGKSDCEQKCVNTPGSYSCLCNEGYTVSACDPKQCEVVTLCPIAADIIFVSDASDSIGPKNFEVQKEFMDRVMRHFLIGPENVRFGAVIYSDYTVRAFDLKDFEDTDSISKKIKSISYLKGMTYTDDALNLIYQKDLFAPVNGGRDNAVDIVIVISDGASVHPDLTIQAAEIVKDNGTIILSIGIGSDVRDKELQGIASKPEDVFKVDSHDFLFTIEQLLANRACKSKLGPTCDEEGNKICQQICKDTSNGYVCLCNTGSKLVDGHRCEDIDQCHSAEPPCEQICTSKPGGFKCSCQAGFAVRESDPTKCDKISKCLIQADIIFVMDASDSIGAANYEVQKDFVDRLTQHFNVGPQDVRFSVVAYSDITVRSFDLQDSKNAAVISDKIKKIKYLHGMTYTDEGLKLILKKKLFSKELGGRDSAVDVVIVISDGASTDPKFTIKAADDLKEKGATIIAVGIGTEISNEELQAIASSPEDVIKSVSYDALLTIEQRVAHRACESKLKPTCAEEGNKKCEQLCQDTQNGYACACKEGYRIINETQCEDIDQCQAVVSPCEHKCINTIGGYGCLCNEGYAVSFKDISKCDKIQQCHIIADIIFLMDISQSIGASNFELQKDFIIRVVQHFVVGPKDVRFATIYFHDVAKIAHKLNDTDDAKVISEKIKKIKYPGKGMTYTDEALGLISHEQLFLPENGGRDDTVKLVIVVTDGASVHPERTIEAASSLKNQGITIVSVAIGSEIVEEELLGISSSPDSVLKVDSYGAIFTIEQQLANIACETEGKISCAEEGNKKCEHICSDTTNGYVCKCNKGYKLFDGFQCKDIDECIGEKRPCEHKCLNTPGGYSCTCDSGFTVSETNLEKCTQIQQCHRTGDIIFVLDASDSIGKEAFEVQKSFVLKVAEHFPIGPKESQFGVVVYSDHVKRVFDLKDHKDTASITTAIQAVPYLTGMTYTDMALSLLLERKMFFAENGGRKNAEHIVIVVTDGVSLDRPATIEAAKNVKEAGATIISVGIGDEISEEELQAIATDSKHVFKADSYEVLPFLETQVANSACRVPSTV